MPFINEILKYSHLSIVGMEKNTGKTECLNYILQRLKNSHKKIAITSIGIDGENLDQVTATHKPEISLYEGTMFVTSESHYRQRRLVSEIYNISERRTSLGRLITAKAITSGNVIISGPTTNAWLKQTLNELSNLEVDLSIVDGALSRKTQAAPTITQSLILTTGAALSTNLPELVRQTVFFINLLNLPAFINSTDDKLEDLDNGIYAIDNENIIHNLNIPSTLLLNQHKDKLFFFGNTFFISGIVTDSLLNFMRMQKGIAQTTIIVKDFTKLFISAPAFQSFSAAGGKIQLLLKNKLITLCINPTSPAGFTLNSELLCQTLQDTLQIPVYDLFKIQHLS